MLAEGVSFNAIKRQLRTTAPTISRWKTRSSIPAWMGWILITRANRQAC
jgi:hypothetical protein